MRWLTFAKIAVAAAVLGYLVQRGTLSFEPIARLADWPGAAAATILLIFLTLPVGAWRWHLLLCSQGIRLKWSSVYHINAIGNFSGMFLPGAAGGDALRVLLIVQQAGKGKRTAATLSVAIDRVTGLLGLITVGMAATAYRLLARGDQADLSAFLPVMAAGIAVAIAAGMVAIFICRRLAPLPVMARLAESGRVGELLSKLIVAAAAYGDAPGALVGVVVLAALTHVLTVAGLVTLATAIGPGALEVADYSVATAVALLANVIPLTPGGLGIGEGAFAQMCQLLDPTHAGGYAAIFLAYRALTSLALLPGALSWIVYRHAPPPPADHQGEMA